MSTTRRNQTTAPKAPVRGHNRRFKNLQHESVLDEASRAGLLEGERTEHVSFRAPPALVEAAKREAGISSTSELGVLALAMLARPDPVAAFFRKTEGQLGGDHDLEY